MTSKLLKGWKLLEDWEPEASLREAWKVGSGFGGSFLSSMGFLACGCGFCGANTGGYPLTLFDYASSDASLFTATFCFSSYC